MDLLKKQVTHRVFGLGNIVDFSDSFVEIQFPKGNKKFVFPDAFGTYLILSDQRTATAVKKIKEKRMIELEKEEIRNAEERATQLKEQQVRMRNENLIRNLKIHPSSQAVFWCQEEDQTRVFEDWSVTTGAIKTGEKKGKLNRPARLHQNSACLLTARAPEEHEQDRRILGVFMVSTEFVGKTCEDGIVPAHEEFRIQLTEKEAEAMYFWNYYVNEKSPHSMTWNTGRYRYFDNVLMAQILRDIISLKKKAPEKEAAQNFFDHFCKINRIDKIALPKPNGSLLRD
ncbi:MAG: hypothetical protein WC977_05330 [Anaerovoracaceae bacterium]